MTSKLVEISEKDGIVLVTGASGFLGSHVIKQLLENGCKVRGTVRSLSDEKKTKPLKNLVKEAKFELELVAADLCDEKSWLDAVRGCSYVVHTASPVPNYGKTLENLCFCSKISITFKNIFKLKF